MIKRRGETWTTVQCQKCEDCFQVLNDRCLPIVSCPYCDGSVPIRTYKEWSEGAQGALKPTKISCAKKYPEVREEDTVGYQRRLKSD